MGTYKAKLKLYCEHLCFISVDKSKAKSSCQLIALVPSAIYRRDNILPKNIFLILYIFVCIQFFKYI